MAFILTFSITYGFLVLRTDEIIHGAVSTKLPGRCEIIQFRRGPQPVYTIVLSCPRMDMIGLWPLPMQKPWFEDSYKNPVKGILGEIGKLKKVGNPH